MTAGTLKAQVRVPGGQGVLVDFEKDRVSMALDVPFPPGTRLEMNVRDLTVHGKVIEARRQEGEFRFAITVKLVDVTREARLKLTDWAAEGRASIP